MVCGAAPPGGRAALVVALSGTGWRLAPCLATLLAQVDAEWPTRDHASDGTIGDTAHKAEGAPTFNNEGYGTGGSDHDPDVNGYVCALDIDSGPNIDVERLVAGLTTGPNSRLSYLIWNRRIFSSRSGTEPFAWHAYNGADPHTNHVHVSVRHLVNFIVNAATWNIGAGASTPAPAAQRKDTNMARMVAHSAGARALVTLNDKGDGTGDQLIAQGCAPFVASTDGKVSPSVFHLSSPATEIVATSDGHGILVRFADGHFDVAPIDTASGHVT